MSIDSRPNIEICNPLTKLIENPMSDIPKNFDDYR